MTEESTIDHTYTPPEAADHEQAAYALSLPDRTLGNWDDRYIRVVTGYGWDHWDALGEGTIGFRDVFGHLQTHQYLVQSYRYLVLSHMLSREEQDDVRELEAKHGYW